MIVERSMHPAFTSNSYLVAAERGGPALVVDTGGDPAPLLERARGLGARVELVLLTHHHHDHVANTGAWVASTGCTVAAHPLEAARLLGGASAVDRALGDGEQFAVGELEVRCLHLPGHTDGQLGFVVRHGDETCVFTGDTLFRGSVGGTRAPGHTDIADLRRSIMERLMALPHQWPVYPGHTDATTIGAEWATNPFVLAWRGELALSPEPADFAGVPVELLLRARDYDGGTKCWVRHRGGSEDIVPGSRVRSLG